MVKPHLKAIVTDIDDTLVDTSNLRPQLEFLVSEDIIKEAQKHALEDSWLKAATSDEVFLQYRQMYRERGPNAQDHINHLLKVYGIEEPILTSLVQFAVDTYHNKRDEWLGRYVLPGVEEVIPWIKRRGLALAALSNGSSTKQKEKLKYMGIDAHFDLVLTSQEVGSAHGMGIEEAGKPNRLAYEALRDRLSAKIGAFSSDNILYIDDRLDHLAGAALAGWNNTVHMMHGKYGNQTPEEVASKLNVAVEFVRPKHRVTSFVELVTAVLPMYSLRI
jgi:FMN phosphatase YigB (HAD superfamily)